ncbi:hypothetical protein SAMN02927900_01294 [Rhizobium mongolense subsp. loessense]|uniref:Uncharacterized protein n=1 Tax=Rhizobium mongolense subsp. loessense TaxID=158890 RepID=A0A1G4Q3C2_9HYPH|nr:hypothetical protein [Rhizobium mongolense]SCW39076.1 hypothetical protein SAMN02927900_01294 [Rhizobium mongolense subsp. loessense]
MAYDTSGFKLLLGGLSGAGNMNTWLLDSVDAIATVNTSNYVSDGYKKGARQGDIVIVRTRTTTLSGPVTAVNYCWVIDEATGTDTLGIDLTDGLAVTPTDTD